MSYTALMENWRTVEDFDHYEVSREGRIRNRTTGLVLTPYVRGKYPCVTLHAKGGRAVRQVHHVVLETFVGARPKGLVGAHLDGQVSNSALTNLKWVTPAENEAHKVAHGTSQRGSQSGQAKFSDLQVAIIREISNLGVGVDKIGVLTNVSSSTINKIIAGKRYAAP